MSNKIDTLTDKQLVEKVLSGNTNAFSVIIKNTEGLVAQFVFKMVADTGERRDVVQDIYLKAFKNLPGFRFGSKLSTWIGQIAYNTCLDHIRKKKLVLTDDLEPGNEEDEQSFVKRVSNYKNQDIHLDIYKKERSEILRTEIEKLSPINKTLISLYHNEEMSYEEIAEITGLPQGTVKSYLFRARRALRDSLLLHYKKEEL